MLHVPTNTIDIAEPITELDIRGAAEAAALIGTDVQRGLAEVRRLHANALACYAVSNAMIRSHKEICGQDYEAIRAFENSPEYLAADAASDEAGHHHHYAVLHMLRLPVRSVDDIRDKAAFASEQADYTDDEDIPQTILKQIGVFFAGNAASDAPALQVLIAEWDACIAAQDREEQACIAATEAGDNNTYHDADERHTDLVRKECDLAESIALASSSSFADLRLKANVAIRETASMNMTRCTGELADIERLVRSNDLDLGGKACASLALDVLRLTTAPQPQTFLQAAE